MTSNGWRRIGDDLKNRKYVDAYSVAFVALVLAVLSLVPDVVPDPIRWAALLAGVGILVLRITIPDSLGSSFDDMLRNRFAFDGTPFSQRLENAKEVWVFAPAAINILSAHNCEILRGQLLGKPEGVVRIVVLDPDNSSAVQLAIRQLDDSLDYPVQDFRNSLLATVHQLRTMSSWPNHGSFEYRHLDYNPGFSLIAINPTAKDGRIIVEFHGFHNKSTSSRMHIEISRGESEQWFAYWAEQFKQIWKSASAPVPTSDLIFEEPHGFR